MWCGITDNGAGYSLTMSGTGGTLILSGTDSYKVGQQKGRSAANQSGNELPHSIGELSPRAVRLLLTTRSPPQKRTVRQGTHR